MRVLLSVVFIFIIGIGKAQVSPDAIGYYVDALRFSQPTITTGSARMQGLSGAQTALGGDISNLTGNPAGLGFFQKSEFSFSAGLNFYNTNSDYISTETKDSKTNLTVPNLGVILSIPSDRYFNDTWRGGSFGISYTRMNNFQNNLSYSGINKISTKADAFIEQANGVDANVFENEAATGEIYDLASAAYASYVLFPYLDDSTFYYTEFRDPDDNLLGGIFQEETVSTTGNSGQWSFSYGGNVADKFYFGASLGVTSINYKKKSTYREALQITAADNELQSFSIEEEHTMQGSGINFSIGVISRPVDWLRIGASATTPTFYTIRETQNLTLTGNSVGYEPVQSQVIPLEYNFRLTTPFKAAFGLAAFAGKHGFLTLDAEYVMYNGMSVEGEGNELKGDDQTIKNLYQAAWNFKGGLEFRKDIFRVRGGAGYYQSPINSDIDGLDRNNLMLTAGFGVRLPQFYMDFALTRSGYNSVYNPYTLSQGNFYSVITKNNLTSGIVSFGVFF